MSTRTTFTDDTRRVVIANGAPVVDRGAVAQALGSDEQAPAPTETRERRRSEHDRPSNMINGRPVSSNSQTRRSQQEDSETEPEIRRPNTLLRSKSDFGPRGDSPDTQQENEGQDWGARHGFEDHYASEEYVSQLANVRCPSKVYHILTKTNQI